MKIQLPGELNIELVLVNDDTDQVAKVTIGLGNGRIPTEEYIRNTISKFEKEDMAVNAPGFRLATKHEYWDQLCLEKAGCVMAMPGGSDFDE